MSSTSMFSFLFHAGILWDAKEERGLLQGSQIERFNPWIPCARGEEETSHGVELSWFCVLSAPAIHSLGLAGVIIKQIPGLPGLKVTLR